MCCRFLDLPDDTKKQVEGAKDNFAYALGWSHEELAGAHTLRSVIAAMPQHNDMPMLR